MIKINMKQKDEQKNRGTALVTLLIFVAMGVVVTSAAVSMTVINTQITTSFASGEKLLHITEAGVENAMLQLLRDPDYTGETVSVGEGSATVTVSGTTTKTIVSEGSLDGFKRKVQATATYENNQLIITGWEEIN
jgi:type II secretory pathway component PulK